jgi:cobaltochelatase CobS
VLACANTYGMGASAQYVGRSALDGATLDRFVRLTWGYDEALELKLCGNAEWHQRVVAIRKACEATSSRVIVSPRASINGAALIAAGDTMKEAEEATIWAGVPTDVQTRIRAAIR